MQETGERSAGFLQWLSRWGREEKLRTKVLWGESVNKQLQGWLEHSGLWIGIKLCEKRLWGKNKVFSKNVHGHLEKLNSQAQLCLYFALCSVPVATKTLRVPSMHFYITLNWFWQSGLFIDVDVQAVNTDVRVELQSSNKRKEALIYKTCFKNSRCHRNLAPRVCKIPSLRQEVLKIIFRLPWYCVVW